MQIISDYIWLENQPQNSSYITLTTITLTITICHNLSGCPVRGCHVNSVNNLTSWYSLHLKNKSISLIATSVATSPTVTSTVIICHNLSRCPVWGFHSTLSTTCHHDVPCTSRAFHQLNGHFHHHFINCHFTNCHINNHYMPQSIWVPMAS